jgi:Ca2+-binding RTX toxin-like protein
MKFNPEPASLKSLGKSIIERTANRIFDFQINLNTGFSNVALANGSSVLFNLNLNLYNDSLIKWERAIGSENLGFIQNLRQRALDGGYNNSESLNTLMPTYEGEKWGWRTLGDGGWVTESPFLNSISNFSQKNALPDFEESIQYGDNMTLELQWGRPIMHNDYLIGWKNTDELYGLIGNDTLDGQGGDDVLYGGYGNDILIGGEGSDVLYGEQSNDSILGGAGNDYLEGGLGLDTMNGGEGNDTYLIDNAKDVIIDGNGIDTILIPIFMTYTLPNNIDALKLTGSDDSNATGNSLNNTLTGNEGENSLNGAFGNDVINAGIGDDTLGGGVGNDNLLGGVGDDELMGGTGNDTLRGGEGIDYANYEAMASALNVNLLTGIAAGEGNDRLLEIENISAGSGNDTLVGNAVSNEIEGGSGNDIIDAGTGDDTLTGASGKDIMSGGVGSDIFSYQNVTESDIVNPNGFDLIKDFNLSEGDKIDLSAMDAKSGGTANDSFSFYSTAPKTAGASSNGAVWFSNGFLFASNDTDIQAEFKVAMNGVSSINASNIIL